MHMWQNTAQGEIGQSQAKKKREKKVGGPDRKTRYGLHAYIAIEPSALSDTRAILCRKAGTSWDRPSNGHGKKTKHRHRSTQWRESEGVTSGSTL